MTVFTRNHVTKSKQGGACDVFTGNHVKASLCLIARLLDISSLPPVADLNFPIPFLSFYWLCFYLLFLTPLKT